MTEWVCRNRDVFLMNYIEIGDTYKAAKTLQEEHNHFTMNSMVCSFFLLESIRVFVVFFICFVFLLS